MTLRHRPKISFSRPIASYAKVRTSIGHLVRGRRFQLRRERVQNLRYLNLGCGLSTHENFINLDYLWREGVDVCWDISRGLPFPNGSMMGIFAEHCLEHFTLSDALQILNECRRILAPGGTLRIVVPDGEMYLRTYCRQLGGDTEARFPFQDQEAFEGAYSPILSVNRIFYQDRDSPHGHCFMYDFQILRLMLSRCSFESAARVKYRSGGDCALLIDSPARAPESLYVEAMVSGVA